MIEPGRTRRRHLCRNAYVRPSGQHQSKLMIGGAPEVAYFDDAAERRRMLKGVDAGEANMVRAASWQLRSRSE